MRHGAGQRKQITGGKLRSRKRRTGGGRDLQNLATKAQPRAIGGRRDLDLANVAQHRKGGQVDPVLAGCEIDDPVDDTVGRQDENIPARAAGQPVAAGAVDQDVVALLSVDRNPAADSLQDIGQCGSRECGGNGGVDHPGGIRRIGKLRQSAFVAAADEYLDLAADNHRRKGADIAKRHGGIVRHGLQMQQPPARQHLKQADPVICPADQNIDTALMADDRQGFRARESRAQIVDHMVAQTERAVCRDPDHRDRVAARRRHHQKGLAREIDGLQRCRRGDAPAVDGADRIQFAQLPVRADLPACQRGIAQAGRKQECFRPDRRLRQRGGVLGSGGGNLLDRQKLPVRIQIEPHQPRSAPDPAIDPCLCTDPLNGGRMHQTLRQRRHAAELGNGTKLPLNA